MQIEMAKAMHGPVEDSFVDRCRDLRITPLFAKGSKENERNFGCLCQLCPKAKLSHVAIELVLPNVPAEIRKIKPNELVQAGFDLLSNCVCAACIDRVMIKPGTVEAAVLKNCCDIVELLNNQCLWSFVESRVWRVEG